MDATLDNLVRFDWVDTRSPGVRMKFRRDGTGWYERDGAPGTRAIHDNLLYRVDAGTLGLKFAHARLWTNVAFQLAKSEPKERIGEFALTLGHDPYALAVEDRETKPLDLLSDPGAALPD